MTLRRLVARIILLLAGTIAIVSFFGELRRTSGFAQMLTILLLWFVVLDLVTYLRDRAKPASERSG